MVRTTQTAEADAVDAVGRYLRARLGAGYTLRKLVVVLDGPDGIRQTLELLPRGVPIGRVAARAEAVAESEAPAEPPAPGQPAPGEFRHSRDYRSVVWGDQTFSFTPLQAAVVRLLHEAKKNKTPDMSGDALLELAGSNTKRIDLAFREHPAWRTLIVAGESKGAYRLADPPAVGTSSPASEQQPQAGGEEQPEPDPGQPD